MRIYAVQRMKFGQGRTLFRMIDIIEVRRIHHAGLFGALQEHDIDEYGYLGR